jgi:hypothetical protein
MNTAPPDHPQNERGDAGKGRRVVRPARPKTLSNQIGRMWNELGQRAKDQRGKRYDFKQVHGFRKFFKTTS